MRWMKHGAGFDMLMTFCGAFGLARLVIFRLLCIGVEFSAYGDDG